VDRFLRLTEQDFDRGSVYTPAAFLVDYAHGWEPAPYWPNSFKNWHGHSDRWLYGDHEKMLERYFWTAYYPMGRKAEEPVSALNEVYVAGVFGDIFDVICAHPDVKRWTTIDTYALVIANGEIEITVSEGKRLAKYVNDGGTLMVADAHLSGPGVKHLGLPDADGPESADAYRWLADTALYPSGTFRFRPIRLTGKDRVLASTGDGKPFCVSSDRGKGRLVYISVPHGLTVGKQIMPVIARLMVHLTSDLMPVEVQGDVNWMVNRTDAGWVVTLMNPEGQTKPQQGILPTDYRENRDVRIVVKDGNVTSAVDKLLPTDVLAVEQNTVRCEVVAGGLRIVEIR
jgi:hypothetical protein